MTQIVLVVGTRPDAIKMAPLIKVMKQHRDVSLVYTGQHYSNELFKQYQEEFGFSIDHNLVSRMYIDVHELFGPLVQNATEFLKARGTGIVAVYGDTLSALAVGIAAKNAGWRLAHIEAGLRSHDLTMPEEVARMSLDHMSDILFCPTMEHFNYLFDKEGVKKSSTYMVGNLVQDAVDQNLVKVFSRPRQGIIFTTHRRENRDITEKICKIVAETATRLLQRKVTLIAHPGILATLPAWVKLAFEIVDPVSYKDMLSYIRDAYLVMTDSGGLQEECALIGTPCVTLRRSTERPETVESGWNIVINPHTMDSFNAAHTVVTFCKMVLCDNRIKVYRYAPYSPAEEMCRIFLQELG